MTKLYSISHSMADAYMSCQKKFEYAHIEKIAPAVKPDALARGIWGHKVLELFFNGIKAGYRTEEAKRVALLNAMDEPKYYNLLWDRIDHFIDEIYPSMGWQELIAIEETYRIAIKDSYQFAFTVDLVVRSESGDTIAIDFKFGADDYSDELLALYPQLPKYVGALNVLNRSGSLDYAPNKAMYVFIRSRANIKDPDKYVVVRPLVLSSARIQNSFREQDFASRAILAHMADDERPYPRTFNNNCKYCPYLQLCIKEINGASTEEVETMKQVLYTENDYGYEEDA